MAVCNLFRQLSKETGNFLMFDQYSDDLTRSYVQHDNYEVMPSKFVVCNIDYSKLKDSVRQGDNYNEYIPTYFQNYIENGCAWLKSSYIDQRTDIATNEPWDPKKWNPYYSRNIFWNTLLRDNLLSIHQYDENWIQGDNAPVEDDKQPYQVISEVKYIGKIDIHSYEEKDGIGYSEIYCYIPNHVGETLYKIEDLNPGHLPDSFMYDREYCMGCDETTKDIIGTLPTNIISPMVYQYGEKYAFMGCDFDEGGYDFTDISAMRDANEFRKLYGLPESKSFNFNTIFVLYDICSRDKDGNATVLYKDIPMGVYFTGTLNDDGVMSNVVTKYSTCEDAYNSGTSYGLRICTRYMCTPNATTISSVDIEPADQYAGFAIAMNSMAESQRKMDNILETSINNIQDMKDYLAEFKNSKANCPYIRQIGKDYYWFVNGRNTGVSANGRAGKDGKNGTIIELIEMNGTYYWALNGVVTNVRAEGMDGSNGLPGPKGDPGVPGHTPSITIKTATDNQKHWFIDNVDTGIPAEGINGKDGKDGKDGYTPQLMQGTDGYMYWSINGISTGVRASAQDGRSLHMFYDSNVVFVSGIPYIVNYSTETWAAGDSMMYIGGIERGGINTGDVVRLERYIVNKGWVYTVLGSVYPKSSRMVIDKATVENTGKTKSIQLVASSGDTSNLTVKNNDMQNVHYSTTTHKYINLNNNVYCPHGPSSLNETFIEIPYNILCTKSGSQYQFFVVVDSKYAGLRGRIVVKPTKLDKSSSGIYAFNSDDGQDIESLNQSYKNIVLGMGKYKIWKNLTKTAKQAVNHSYDISKHIGRVFVYVDLYSVYGAYHKAFDISQPGILNYSKMDSTWHITKSPYELRAKPVKNVLDFIKSSYNGHLYAYTKFEQHRTATFENDEEGNRRVVAEGDKGEAYMKWREIHSVKLHKNVKCGEFLTLNELYKLLLSSRCGISKKVTNVGDKRNKLATLALRTPTGYDIYNVKLTWKHTVNDGETNPYIDEEDFIEKLNSLSESEYISSPESLGVNMSLQLTPNGQYKIVPGLCGVNYANISIKYLTTVSDLTTTSLDFSITV